MKLIPSALFGVILLQTTAFAGSLDNSGSPTTGSGMPSTTAIYNRLDTGADISIPNIFQEPTAGPVASGRTLAEIASKLPAADNTNGAVVSDVLAGKVSGDYGQAAPGDQVPVPYSTRGRLTLSPVQQM